MTWISHIFSGSIGDEHEYRLTKYLLSNYDSSVRPVANSSEPIRVIFSMSLYHIIGMIKLFSKGKTYIMKLK